MDGEGEGEVVHGEVRANQQRRSSVDGCGSVRGN